MSRARRLALLVLASLVLLAGALVWALPEIVRRVAVDRISRQTRRAVTIEDIDLNLFTGRLAVKSFRLAERDGREPFVEAERLDVRLGLWDLLRSHVRIREIALVAPAVRIIRQGPGDFNFSDLLAGAKERPSRPGLPAAGPCRSSARVWCEAGCTSRTGRSRRRPSGWSRTSISTRGA